MSDPRLTGRFLTANEELLDRAIRHQIFLARLSNTEAAAVRRLLARSIIPSLNRQIMSSIAGVDTTAPRTIRLSRLESLDFEFREIIRAVMEPYQTTLNERLLEITKMESDATMESLRRAIPSQINIRLNTPRLDILRQMVNTQPYNGRTLEAWYDSISTNTQQRLNQTLRVGLSQGETMPQITRRVRRVTGQTARHAQTVARTAVNGVTNNAREHIAEQNTDIITGVRYVAVLDTRTTVICASLDGQVFEVGKGPRPPQHANCRSTTVPMLKSFADLGIPVGDLPEPARASMDGLVPGTTTYSEWLKRQPESSIREVLGRERAKLFIEGKVELSTLLNESGTLMTLAELRKREGI